MLMQRLTAIGGQGVISLGALLIKISVMINDPKLPQQIIVLPNDDGA